MYASAVPYPHSETGISSGKRVRARRSRRSVSTESATAIRNGSARMRPSRKLRPTLTIFRAAILHLTSPRRGHYRLTNGRQAARSFAAVGDERQRGDFAPRGAARRRRTRARPDVSPLVGARARVGARASAARLAAVPAAPGGHRHAAPDRAHHHSDDGEPLLRQLFWDAVAPCRIAVPERQDGGCESRRAGQHHPRLPYALDLPTRWLSEPVVEREPHFIWRRPQRRLRRGQRTGGH